MDNNPQNLVSQALRPPQIGCVGSRSFGINYSMQFGPAVPEQPGQSYMPTLSRPMQQWPGQPGHFSSSAQPPMSYMQPSMQFQHAVLGQPSQSYMPMLSRPVQQWSGQPGHHPSSSQPPLPYMQLLQFQNSSNPFNHMPSLAHPSYIPPVAQTHWIPPMVEMVPQTGQQPTCITPSNQAANWEEIRYYRSKKTNESSWEIPFDLMTRVESAYEQANKEASRGTQSSSLNPVAFTPVSANMHSSRMSTLDNSSSHEVQKALDRIAALKSEVKENLEKKRHDISAYRQSLVDRGYDWHASPNQASIISKDEPAVWQMISARDGKKHYYNKKTMQTTWKIPLELAFEDPVERAKAREETEVKKFQQLAKDCSGVLHDFQEITASLTWEEFQQLFEESYESRAIDDENIAREKFMRCFASLVVKVNEKEKKPEEEKARARKEGKDKWNEKEIKKKEKYGEVRNKSKDKERWRKHDSDSEHLEAMEHEDKRRERKHWKFHRNDASSDKDDSRKSRRHSSDPKKSRRSWQHG